MNIVQNINLLFFVLGTTLDCKVQCGRPKSLVLLACQPEIVQLDTILPAAKIDYSSLTVSGWSGGASMSMQYHFVHSAEVKGAGIFAGVPYGTFYVNTIPVPGALRFVTGPNIVGPFPGTSVPLPLVTRKNSELEVNAESFAKSGLIDDTKHLNGSRVYVFHGKLDAAVAPVYGKRVVDMYKHYGAIVKSKLNMMAHHPMPTDNYPTLMVNCAYFNNQSRNITNCGYEGVFTMFKHLYGKSYKAPKSSSVNFTGDFSAFFQGPYTASGDAGKDFMGTHGYLYVPKYCQNKTHICKIHMAFHGCLQNIHNDFWCNNFALKQGYLPVADANNVVIVFPQVALNKFNLKLNSNVGCCWDFYGGVSDTAWFKTGPHIVSVRNISRAVAKLSGTKKF